MQPKKSITEMLTDSIKLESEELIEEIIESEDWLGESSEPCEEAIYPNNKINSPEDFILDKEIPRPKRMESNL